MTEDEIRHNLATKFAKEWYADEWDIQPSKSLCIGLFIEHAQIALDFAKEYHSAKMQKVGEDVESEIKRIAKYKYPYFENPDYNLQNDCDLNKRDRDLFIDAMCKGYNLHKSDAVELLRFIEDNELKLIFKYQGCYEWNCNNINKPYCYQWFSHEQLYQHFTQSKSKTK